MKKLLILLFLLPTLSFGQIIINQEVVEAPPYQVGDTITIRYTFQNLTGQSDFRYFWLRLHYSNKHLQLVPNSTQFVDAATRQTYFYQWVGYSFNSNPNIGVGELDKQLQQGGYQYVGNQDWNVVQLNMQLHLIYLMENGLDKSLSSKINYNLIAYISCTWPKHVIPLINLYLLLDLKYCG
jgi:hypothetical protein